MDNKIKNTIDILSQLDSYEALFYHQNTEIALPSIDELREIVALTRKILFPGYFENLTIHSESVRYYIGVQIEKLKSSLTKQIYAGLCFSENYDDKLKYQDLAKQIALQFIEKLPTLREVLSTDIEAAYNGDPAANSKSEVILCYPAIRAISNYRIAHELLLLNVPIIPRIITEMAHSETGIDIHPGAKIGRYFTIDHGTGVVIGETSIIGDNVKLYQGVTLGAKSFPLDAEGNPIKGILRHPIIEDNVIVYSNSTILGRITIGKNSIIGGNIWVDKDIPAGTKLIQKK
ncbi:MAG: serine acetyltransferase [Paludibacteraceae bacterium]|nr:serine acetyltransferase [Paludibacteraceae bacterium]MBR5470246.1 serine acetyltransferase [Paludibacteraceae bacterium]